MGDLKLLPNNGMAPSNKDVARHLREMADWMEEEDASPIKTVVIITEHTDGTMAKPNVCGYPCDTARIIGLLTILVARAALGEDDQ